MKTIILAVILVIILVVGAIYLAEFQNNLTRTPEIILVTPTPEIILVTPTPEPTRTNIPNWDIPETTRKPEKDIKW